MSELHSIGLTETSRHKLETVSPQFISDGLYDAQKKSWEVFHEIKSQLKEGMTEAEGRALAYTIFEKKGVKAHWHRPWARFGPGTVLTFNHNTQPTYQLQVGDPVFLDLGPVWKDPVTQLEYEGDIGDTFVFGENAEAEKCIQAVKKLFLEAKTEWKEKKLTGQSIYTYLRQRAREEGYELIEEVSGHRLSDYPHFKYSKANLAKLEFSPSPSLWILELQIKHPTLPIGAFHEDLL